MPVTITINGENAHQALAELMTLSEGVMSSAPAALQAEPVPDAERKEFPPAEPAPRKARAPKAAKPVELEEVAVEQEAPAEPEAPFTESDTAANAASTETKAKSASGTATEAPSGSAANASPSNAPADFTEDDARRALSDLSSQPNGKELCRAVLTKFGAAKISEVPADQRKAFIAEIAKMRGVA